MPMERAEPASMLTAASTSWQFMSFIFTAAMFVTFDIAFDVIMPKGPLEAAFGY